LLVLGLDSRRDVGRFLRDLRDVRRRAGKIRDMDVLTADALKLDHDREQDCVVRLLEYLGLKRGEYVKKLRLEVGHVSARLRRDLKRTFKRVEKTLKKVDSNLSHPNPTTTTVARAIELGTELNKPAKLNRANLHSYRLKVKELRNVLQLSEAAGREPFTRDLKEVKDAIGEWHDWQELHRIATHLLDHSSCKLRKDLAATSDSKFEKALVLSGRVRAAQRRLRGLQPRKKARKSSSLSPALIEATAAIAQ